MAIDPQVQICIINLAWKWAEANVDRRIVNAEVRFKELSESFDKAYKVLLKTILAEQ